MEIHTLIQKNVVTKSANWHQRDQVQILGKSGKCIATVVPQKGRVLESTMLLVKHTHPGTDSTDSNAVGLGWV